MKRLTLCFLILFSSLSYGFDEGELIKEVYIDRTTTRFGQYFFKNFVSAYKNNGGPESHGGLAVYEKPSARRGSKITVIRNRKILFTTFLSPTSRDIERRAEQAGISVAQQIQKIQAMSMLEAFIDPDLAADEF